jgi:hypothetical protein
MVVRTKSHALKPSQGNIVTEVVKVVDDPRIPLKGRYRPDLDGELVSDPLTPATIDNPASLHPILPDKPSASQGVQFFTYRAQLTFGHKPRQQCNAVKFLSRFIFAASDSIAHFLLLPFDNVKGQQVSTVSQLPDENPDFYAPYYHNHRILATGNLNGMVLFQTSQPWTTIKSPKGKFFCWLHLNKVYIDYTKFKTSTLVPCGFLHGAHPGYLRREEAEEELCRSLSISQTSLPFQLSARTISIPISEGKPDRYYFLAVIAETSVEHAAALRERFYSLSDPFEVKRAYPYVGGHQFILLLKSKEWPTVKIYKLAVLHTQLTQLSKPIFVHNVADLQTPIGPSFTLRGGFNGMISMPTTTSPTRPLIYSIHNTSNLDTKVALVTPELFDDAVTQLAAVHSILLANVP